MKILFEDMILFKLWKSYGGYQIFERHIYKINQNNFEIL